MRIALAILLGLLHPVAAHAAPQPSEPMNEAILGLWVCHNEDLPRYEADFEIEFLADGTFSEQFRMRSDFSGTAIDGEGIASGRYALNGRLLEYWYDVLTIETLRPNLGDETKQFLSERAQEASTSKQTIFWLQDGRLIHGSLFHPTTHCTRPVGIS